MKNTEQILKLIRDRIDWYKCLIRNNKIAQEQVKEQRICTRDKKKKWYQFNAIITQYEVVIAELNVLIEKITTNEEDFWKEFDDGLPKL